MTEGLGQRLGGAEGAHEGVRGQRRLSSHRSAAFWYQSVHVSEARASCRYRIGNLVSHLRGATALIGQSSPRGAFDGIRTLCCLRPLPSPGLQRQLRNLQQRGTTLVADFDDLLFAGAVSGLPSSAQGRSAQYARGLALFDELTVSTRALARTARRLHPALPVTLVPNGLSEAWVEHGRSLSRPWQPGDPHVIRYLCGSPSHDDDFASIAPSLRRFLNAHPGVRLEIIGPLSFDASRFDPARLSHRPSILPFEQLPSLLASAWVSIAPLVNNEFNEHKSAIKFLEAAAFGCPSLVTPNDDARRHAEQGAPVLLCETSRDWLGALEAMLEPSLRVHTGARSREYVLRHGMAAHSARAWRQRFAAERAP